MAWIADTIVYALAMLGVVWAIRDGKRQKRPLILTGMFFGLLTLLITFVLFLVCAVASSYAAGWPLALCVAAGYALTKCMEGGIMLCFACFVIGLTITVIDERRLKIKPRDKEPPL